MIAQPILSLSKMTPLERIFQKVMHRKMTADERRCFRIKRVVKPAIRKPV